MMSRYLRHTIRDVSLVYQGIIPCPRILRDETVLEKCCNTSSSGSPCNLSIQCSYLLLLDG